MLIKLIKYIGIHKLIFYFFSKYRNDKFDINKCIKELETYCPNSKDTCIRKNDIKEESLSASIIVPAYNVEKFIKQCICSLIAQNTVYKYEIIVINDGSTDKTLDIIKNIQCDFLKVINKSNGGISSARNVGIENARGKYLIFCDADDFMEENALQNLISKAEDTGSDIVEGTYQYISEEGILARKVRHPRKEANQTDTFGVPWCKCIKKSLFDNICFPESYWFEDSIIHQIILPRANKITWIDDIVYFYRKNSGGATSNAVGNPRSIESLWISIALFRDRKILGLKITKEYYIYMYK